MTTSDIIEQASTISLFGHTFNIYATMILVIFALIIYGLDKARRSKKIDWIDMITSTDQATGEVQASTPKILQIIGGITGTFIVTKLTLQNNINWDIFAIYLAYVSGVDGFSRFMLAKYGVQTPPAQVIAPIVPPPAPAPAPAVVPVPAPIPAQQPVNVTVDVQSMNVKPRDDDN